MKKIVVLVLAAAALAAAPRARAAVEPVPEPAREKDPAARERALQELALLDRQLAACLEYAQYDKALGILNRQIAIAPSWPDPHYNRACMLARLKQNDAALAALRKAIDLGWGNLRLMLRDPDIEPLRGEAAFADLVAAVRKNRDKTPVEAGEEIAGVRTVERELDTGLRYRVRMSPEATAEKPQRLIVWMHPAGWSMNRQVERLSTNFNRMGFALLVPTRKQMANWTASEIEALLVDTVADAGTVPGLDHRRPILMGFSAGGQAALRWYFAKADLVGGLVLDAAYPVAPAAGGRVSVLRPPPSEAAKKAPVIAFVGSKDGGSQIWAVAADPWTEAGVPLTVVYVAGMPHTWMIRDRQLAQLETWLGEVAAGGLPKGIVGTAPPKPEPSTPAESPPTPPPAM